MPKKKAAPDARWNGLVQAVIDAKAAIEPLYEPLHQAEVIWNVERAVAAREKREPSAEVKAVYDAALKAFEDAKQAAVDAQAAMKAG